MNNPRYVMLAGAAAIILGSVLPWVTATTIFGDLSRNGTDTSDGIFTLGLGVVAGIFGLFAQPVPGRRVSWVVVIGGLAGVTAFIKINDVSAVIQEAGDIPYGNLYVGIGLYVLMAGAVICIVGGLMRWPVPPPTEPPNEDPTGHTPVA